MRCFLLSTKAMNGGESFSVRKFLVRIWNSFFLRRKAPKSMKIIVWYLFDNDNERERREEKKLHSSMLYIENKSMTRYISLTRFKRRIKWISRTLFKQKTFPLDFCWQSERKSRLMAIERDLCFLFHSFELNATYAFQMTCLKTVSNL